MGKKKFYDVAARKSVQVDDSDISYRITKNKRYQLVAMLGDHCAYQMASEETAKSYPKFTGSLKTKCKSSAKKSPGKKSAPKKSASKKSATKKSASKKSPGKKSPCKPGQARNRQTKRCKDTITTKRAKCKAQGKVLSSTTGRCKKRGK